jgi:uncharacterized protein
MSQELPFDPFPFISDPHQQTIISSLINLIFDPSSESRIVNLQDGDRLCVEITTPEHWQPNGMTVVMVHGLCGSHRSPILVRMAKKLEPLNLRIVRVNLRGCGTGKGLAKHMYHCGQSDDIFEVIKQLKKETPDSPFVLIGFSLGGNLVLKMGGELGDLAKQFLAGLIAISPPVDLHSSVAMLGKPENSFYDQYFSRLLRADVKYRQKKFKDLPRVKLPRHFKLIEFDEFFTAPQYGFKSAMDYYNKCSAGPLVENIGVPCKILLAEDDPIISSSSLDIYQLPSNVIVFKTKKGGHMGYLGNPSEGKGLYWLDSLLTDWILGFMPEEP